MDAAKTLQYFENTAWNKNIGPELAQANRASISHSLLEKSPHKCNIVQQNQENLINLRYLQFPLNSFDVDIHHSDVLAMETSKIQTPCGEIDSMYHPVHISQRRVRKAFYIFCLK